MRIPVLLLLRPFTSFSTLSLSFSLPLLLHLPLRARLFALFFFDAIFSPLSAGRYISRTTKHLDGPRDIVRLDIPILRLIIGGLTELLSSLVTTGLSSSSLGRLAICVAASRAEREHYASGCLNNDI